MSYIKKLVMHGFKSFPKKTEVPFTHGINIILGPNGSGKSNVSDAICFVLGRLSIKSMRAAKAGNLIFMGTKETSPSKEASVEIVFDNSQNTFSIEKDEISIKRIVRKNGQSIYKINNETKTRQEVLSLLAQAGIDPQGFNIVLQGEIQNFVRMQPEERRKVIEEVSGISVYESRKEKSLKELEKTEDRLKEISSILRERTSYLNNLEKERQQALRAKKLESDIKIFKASMISFDLVRKKRESEKIISEIEKKNSEIEKVRKIIVGLETEVKNLEGKIDEINRKIQKSAGMEQEVLNGEIANLRAELAGIIVKLENQESKLEDFGREKQDLQSSMRETEYSLRELQSESSRGKSFEKKAEEIEKKKEEFEKLEEQRKKFYMIKSEFKSIKGIIQDKTNLSQNYENESNILLRQMENISMGLFDSRATEEKLQKLKTSLAQKRESLSQILRKEVELEKMTSVSESEIENQKKLLEKISKLDICPVCKNKITPKHMEEIKSKIIPRVNFLKKGIESADHELKTIYQKKEIFTNDVESLSEEISKTDSDLNKISNIKEKKKQISLLREKTENLNGELSSLEKREKSLGKNLDEYSKIEHRYETLKIDIQDISLRTSETVNSEVSFKERELDRMKLSLKQIAREEADVKEELISFKKIKADKEKILSRKKVQEEELSKKFRSMISARDSFQSKIRGIESETMSKQNDLHRIEQDSNEFKIEKARVDAEVENLETEILEFQGIGVIKANKEVLAQRLSRAQEILSRLGTVNFRSLEVYDSIKKEYDSIKEKAEIISHEKGGIMKIIHEIDIKKKKAFISTLNQLNELFSRNFSQLYTKGQVSLEIENRKEPFEHGSGVQIIVKTGHGKYFDVKSLSGGEQTLVALSLIFAIQELRPYHFYLLDEIDAALDKRNSERLAGLLSKYMRKGQYIVITHNDEVINKATTLYGVSMHDGISKIISLKL